MQACTLARRTAEHFLKYVSRNVITLNMKVTRDPQNQVKNTLDHLHKQENTVLEFWTGRKKSLDQCQQYVTFEQSAKQVRVYAELLVRHEQLVYERMLYMMHIIVYMFVAPNHAALPCFASISKTTNKNITKKRTP